MKKYAKNEINRLNNVILSDKLNSPARFSELVKSEVYFVLSNYFDLDKKDFFISVDVGKDAYLDIKIMAKAKNMKSVNLANTDIMFE